MSLRLADGFEIGDRSREFAVELEFARRDRAPIFFAADGRVFLLRRRDGLVDFGRDLGPHLLQGFAIQQFLLENQLLGALQANLRERLALNVVAHIARVVMLAVTGETQSRGDDELRWTTGPRAFDGAPMTSRHCVRSVPSTELPS